MNTISKVFGSALALGLVMSGIAGTVQAADYPKKTITFVVPFGAGGGTDRWGRIMSTAAFDVWGHGWRVRNVPGASGVKGWKWMNERPADGHTLYMASPTPIVALAREAKPVIDPLKDVKVCALIGFFRPTVAIHKGMPYKDYKGLVEYAKKNPEKVTVGGSGSNLLGGAVLFSQAGIKVTYVTYPGTGPAVTDFLGKHVDVLVTVDEILQGLAPEKAIALVTSSNKAHPEGYEKAVGNKVLQPKDLGYKESFTPLRWIGVHPKTPDSICKIVSDKMKATLEFKPVANLIKKIKASAVFTPMEEAQKEYIEMVKGTQAGTKLLKKK
jgi:tripartite-type tricarboxylate transporter receptor subunit TctC